jgi:plastocyanin
MRGVPACAALLTFGVAAPAHAAAPNVVLAVAERYVPADVEIAQGESLTLVNGERSPHDITAVDLDGGWPVFKSAILYEPGQTAPVVGVETLGPGLYQFYCSVHELMRGSVYVT